MITAEILKRHDACKDGLAWFNRRYPEGLTLAQWTRDEQIAAFRDGGGRWIMWGAHELLIPFWSLTGANLDGANLDGADLSGADLSGADLTRADLDGANLTRANLTEANLTGANLTRANLDGANLTRAKRLRTDASIPGWTLGASGCCADCDAQWGRLTREGDSK